MLGQSAILDSVASYESVRSVWRELASRHGAAFDVALCTCSDVAVHRARLSGRERGIPGWPELTWDDVERVREYFEPWTEDVYEFDAMEPFESNLARLRSVLES